MDVSSQLLREVEFREQWRGYNPDEVDDFLDRLAVALEQLQERLRETNDRAAMAERRSSDTSGTDDELRRTLVLAQRTADAAIEEGQVEAARLVADAERRAAELLAGARQQAVDATDAARREVREEVEALGRAKDAFEADVAALEGYVRDQRARLGAELQEQVRWLEAPGRLALGLRPTTADPVVPPPAPIFATVDVPDVPDVPATPQLEVEVLANGLDLRERALPAVSDDAVPVPTGAQAEAAAESAMATAGQGADDEAEDDVDDTGPHAAVWADSGAAFASVPPRRLFDDEAEAEAEAEAGVGALVGAAEDDPFMNELRRAVNDPEPLGPRDDAGSGSVPGRPGDAGPDDDGVYEDGSYQGPYGEMMGSSRFRLRRRH